MNKQLWIVKGLCALYYSSNAVLLPYLPLYFSAKGFSASQIGMLMVIGPFVAVFAQPVWGYISDRLQTVKWVVGALWGCGVVSSIGLFYMDGFPAKLTFVTLLYFFLMPTQPLLDALTIRTAEEAGISYGSIRMWGSLGFAAAAVIVGGLLVTIGGVENLKWIYWGIWVSPFLLICFLKDVKTTVPPVTFRTLTSVMRNGPFLWFLLFVLIMTLPHRMNDFFLGLYMSDLGASEQMVGLAWAIAALAEGFAFGVFYRLLNKVHDLALLGIVSILYVARWVLYGLAGDPTLLLILQASHAVTFAMFWMAAVSHSVRAVPVEMRSTGQAVLSAVFIGLSGLGAGVLGGELQERGGYEAAYYIGAVLAGIGAAGFLSLHAWNRWRGHSRRNKP